MKKVEEMLAEIKNPTTRDFCRGIVEYVERAFGGCRKCYGKGYATQMRNLVAAGDWEGEKDRDTGPRVQIRYCSCERGKQLKRLVEGAPEG